MNLENKKQIAIIALAVGLGLVAAYLTGQHIQEQVQQETKVLAKEFKKNDQVVRQEIDMIRNEMKNLATRQIAMAKQTSSGGGGTAEAPAVPKSSLALRTPPGKRAMTIMIDSLSAVGGLINPGDYVDVLAHLSIPAPPDSEVPSEKVTAIIFQNVQVLAVGTNLQSPGGYEEQQRSRSLNITLAVDPEEAGLLTFSQKNGTLQLVLRAPQETETNMLQAANWEALSDYVLDKHGMELTVPRSRTHIQPMPGTFPTQTEEVKPYIQIFRGGREL